MVGLAEFFCQPCYVLPSKTELYLCVCACVCMCACVCKYECVCVCVYECVCVIMCNNFICCYQVSMTSRTVDRILCHKGL